MIDTDIISTKLIRDANLIKTNGSSSSNAQQSVNEMNISGLKRSLEWRKFMRDAVLSLCFIFFLLYFHFGSLSSGPWSGGLFVLHPFIIDKGVCKSQKGEKKSQEI